jgi:tetratricopeptide (TPR) repeat protein
MPAEGVRTRALVFLGACAICGFSGCTVPRAGSPPADYRLKDHEEVFARALAHYAQGLILEGEHGRGCEAALEHYILAEEHDPGHPKTAGRIAIAALRCKEPDLAIEALKRASDRAPGSAAIHAELGTVYRFADRTEESAAHYLESIRIDPASAFPYQAVAAIRFATGDDSRALAVIRRGCDASEDPDRLLDFCRRQATSFLREGEIPRAIPCLTLIAENKASVRRELFHVLGELHLSLGQKTEALQYYRLAVERENPVADAYLKIVAIQQEDDLEACIETLQKAAASFPDNPVFAVLLGDAYDKKGAADEAEEQYEHACRMAAPPAAAFVKLAVAHLRESTGKALATLERGHKHVPNGVSILFAMATLHGSEKRYEKAITLFEKIREVADASDRDKLSARYYLQYAATCEAAGRKKRTEAILREGLEDYPDEDGILNFLAYMWAEEGTNLVEALAFSRKTLEHDPDNAAYIDTLGWIYFKLEKYDLALDRLTRANELQVGEPTLLDHLGDVYSALGQPDKALTYWKQSFSIDPGNDAVEAKLSEQGIDTSALRPEREDREGD